MTAILLVDRIQLENILDYVIHADLPAIISEELSSTVPFQHAVQIDHTTNVLIYYNLIGLCLIGG